MLTMDTSSRGPRNEIRNVLQWRNRRYLGVSVEPSVHQKSRPFPVPTLNLCPSSVGSQSRGRRKWLLCRSNGTSSMTRFSETLSSNPTLSFTGCEKKVTSTTSSEQVRSPGSWHPRPGRIKNSSKLGRSNPFWFLGLRPLLFLTLFLSYINSLQSTNRSYVRTFRRRGPSVSGQNQRP